MICYLQMVISFLRPSSSDYQYHIMMMKVIILLMPNKQFFHKIIPYLPNPQIPDPSSKLSNSSLPKLNIERSFHLSPSELQKKSYKQKHASYMKNKSIKTENQANYLDNYLRMKKISNKPSKFSRQKTLGSSDQLDRQFNERLRNKSEINADIEQSWKFIDKIQKQKSLFVTKQEQVLPKQNNKFTFLRPLGTDDRLSTKQSAFQSPSKDPIGLYSYLQRKLPTAKKSEITVDRIEKFAQSPKNQSFQNAMIARSRKLLKHQVENNYKQYQKIYDCLKQQSKEIIEKDMIQKKKQYHHDFKTRINVPYFSFLSMSPKQRKSVITKCHKKLMKIQTGALQ